MKTLLVSNKETEVQGIQRVSDVDDMVGLISQEGVNWVFEDKSLTNELLKKAVRIGRHRFGSAFLSFPVNVEFSSMFKGWFANVAYGGSATAWLDSEEFLEAIIAENSKDLVIGGVLTSELNLMTLWKGDATALNVPLDCLKTSGDGIKPNLDQFSIGDYGNTLLFGDYEATVESILYEYDADFRRRYRQNLRQNDMSFGACFRRLRKQRSLRQSDFPGVTSKTIERIEANEVSTPQPKTKAIISEVLGVAWADIDTF